METCQSLRGVTSSTISQRRRGADHGVISALAARMEGHVQGPRQIAVQYVAGRPEERGHGEVAPARDEAYAADEDDCEGHGGGAVEPGEQLVPQNVLRVGTNGRSNLQFAPPGATGTPRRVQTPGSCTPSSRRRSCRVLCLRRTCANRSLVSRLLTVSLNWAPDGAPTAREDDLMSARRTRGPRRTGGPTLVRCDTATSRFGLASR